MQNEIAGRDTGRIKRFFGFHAATLNDRSGRRDKASVFERTLDWLLANDATYAALYERVRVRLSELEKVTETALIAARKILADAKADLDDVIERAAKLPDGTAVFRDKNGDIRKRDGSLVDPADAASIVWRGDEPGYEDYQAQRDNADDAQRTLDELEEYQTDVLGAARDRIEDRDNPLEHGELEDLLDDIEGAAPDAVNDADSAKRAPSAEAKTEITDVTLPPIK